MNTRIRERHGNETHEDHQAGWRVSRRAMTLRDARVGATPLHVETFGWKALAGVNPQALGLTYSFEPNADGTPYSVTIRLAGRRVGVRGKPGPRDRFTVHETVEAVVPGSGPIAVTTRVRDISPGEWRVTAAPVDGARSRPAGPRSVSAPPPRLPHGSSSGTTAFAPVVQILAPGARLGAWPALVGLGGIVGLTVQALGAGHLSLPVTSVFWVSLAASVVGLLVAKLYYATGRYVNGDRGAMNLLSGACIQGFVIGAAGVLVAGARIGGVPVGILLDVTAPGLLVGMTIGRYGCFFGGCCVGRPTASRWGLWSSDRRLGMRRIPVQLLESTVALALGVGALAALWHSPHSPGVVFVGSMGAYTLGRQLLFPLRAGSRHTRYGRRVTIALAVLVVAADIAFVTLAR